MNKEYYVKLLEELIEKNVCVPRTINGFWQTLENYRKESPEEYKSIFGEENAEATIELHDRIISLAVRGSFSDNYIHLVVAYHFYFKKNNTGLYKMVFSLDGDVVDDMFYFH